MAAAMVGMMAGNLVEYLAVQMVVLWGDSMENLMVVLKVGM